PSKQQKKDALSTLIDVVNLLESQNNEDNDVVDLLESQNNEDNDVIDDSLNKNQDP
ncbi:25177_t:CDS:1, partial [Dentiscutata erythropus]